MKDRPNKTAIIKLAWEFACQISPVGSVRLRVKQAAIAAMIEDLVEHPRGINGFLKQWRKILAGIARELIEPTSSPIQTRDE